MSVGDPVCHRQSLLEMRWNCRKLGTQRHAWRCLQALQELWCRCGLHFWWAVRGAPKFPVSVLEFLSLSTPLCRASPVDKAAFRFHLWAPDIRAKFVVGEELSLSNEPLCDSCSWGDAGLTLARGWGVFAEQCQELCELKANSFPLQFSRSPCNCSPWDLPSPPFLFLLYAILVF